MKTSCGSQVLWNICVVTLLLTMTNTAASNGIDWAGEIEKSRRIFHEENEAHGLHDSVRDAFACGFIRISPWGVIKDDFDALEKEYAKHWPSVLHQHPLKPAHTVSICGNTALVWHELILNGGETGKVSVLYVYEDDKAKIKMAHISLDAKP